MAERRGRLLSFLAISFGVLAVSNMLKPLGLEGETTGFVFLGRRLSGVANLIVGPVFGLVLGVYAWGVWNLRRIALPIAWAYAAYVIANLVFYGVHESIADGPGGVVAYLLYAALAIGASVTSAVLLTQRTDELT